jgi:hypothetical protein
LHVQYVSSFQIKLCCRYFGLLMNWTLFGLLFKKLGTFFFKSSCHPVEIKPPNDLQVFVLKHRNAHIRFRSSPEQNGPTVLTESFHRVLRPSVPRRVDAVDSGQPVTEAVDFGTVRNGRNENCNRQRRYSLALQRVG